MSEQQDSTSLNITILGYLWLVDIWGKDLDLANLYADLTPLPPSSKKPFPLVPPPRRSWLGGGGKGVLKPRFVLERFGEGS
jgi:hypothetical protein